MHRLNVIYVLQVIPVFSRVGYTQSPTSIASADDECIDIARVGLYVQEALRQDSVRTPRNTAALLCGMRYIRCNSISLHLCEYYKILQINGVV